MKASSQDLRERVLRAVDCGYPRAEIVQLFGISLYTQTVCETTTRGGACAAESDLGSSSKETDTGGGWRATPVTGVRRRHAGTTLCLVGADPR